MTQAIPLIRAANLLPLVRWIEQNCGAASGFLDAADLGYWFALSPLDPIPTHSGIQLLASMARDFGPDVGCRIVKEASVAEIGMIGAVALGSRTPSEALQRISFAIPMHSSHETLRLGRNSAETSVSQAFAFRTDPASLHAVHVLFASMIQQLCRFTGMQQPLLSRIGLCPHPQAGAAYLEPQFGCPVVAADTPSITITIKDSVMQNPFRRVARDRLPQLALAEIPGLAEDQTLAASVRAVLAAMLHGGEPTVARVARTARISARSLQRRLAEEDTSFSDELNKVRTHLALQHMGAEDVSLVELADRLGYSAQSALTRAVRRLTGHTPSQLIQSRDSVGGQPQLSGAQGKDQTVHRRL